MEPANRRRHGYVKRSTLMWGLPWLALLTVAAHHAFNAYHQWALEVGFAPAAGLLGSSSMIPGGHVGSDIAGAHVEMLAGHGRKERTPNAMNVLFIVADDLRPQLSSYGRGAVTPHLASLAARGVVFDRAFAQTTVCNPSRVSFMTGRKPDITQAWHFEHVGPDDWTSIPRVFADHGWLTVGVGKLWHNPGGPGGPEVQFPDTLNVTGRKYFPVSTEFQPMLALERELQNATVTPVHPKDRHFAPANEFIDVQFADHALHALRQLAARQGRSRAKSEAPGEEGGESDGLAAAAGPPQAEPLIASASPSSTHQPWFLGVGFHAPHEPYVFPSEFWDLYDFEDPLAPPLPYPRDTAQVPRDSPVFGVGDVQSPYTLLYDVSPDPKSQWQANKPWAEAYYCRNQSARHKAASAEAANRHSGGTSAAVNGQAWFDAWGLGGEPPAAALVGLNVGGVSVPGAADKMPPTCSVPAIAEAIRQWRRKFPPARPPAWPLGLPWPPRRRPMPYAQHQELLRGYSAAISFMDSQVGRLLGELEDLGMAASTVVVFTGDHGFNIGDHGQWGKRSLFENDARVPLIIADPSRLGGHGGRSAAIVELVDLLPTLAHLAGINEATIRGPPLSGSSLAHLLNGPSSHTSGAGNKAVHRAAAVTQFVRCPISLGKRVDFREQKSSAIDHGCVRTSRGWQWYEAHELVVMGYSIRTPRWRYTAWLLWDTNTTAPIWRYPPLGEELFDHRMDDAEATSADPLASGGAFDAFEGESLAKVPATAPLRWALFLALKALVQGDQRHELAGGRGLGLAGLVAKGRSGVWGVDPCPPGGLGAAIKDTNGQSDEYQRWFVSTGRSDLCAASMAASMAAGGRSSLAAAGVEALPGGPLPPWLSRHLDRHGLLPPSHAEVAAASATAAAQARQMTAAGGRPHRRALSSASALLTDEARLRYEAAGFQSWPADLGPASALMASSEAYLLPGDVVEVALASDTLIDGDAFSDGEASKAEGHPGGGSGGQRPAAFTRRSIARALKLKPGTPVGRLWKPFVVLATVPRVTLRGEVGAALCVVPAESPMARALTANKGAAPTKRGRGAGGAEKARGSGSEGSGSDGGVVPDLWAEGEQFLSGTVAQAAWLKEQRERGDTTTVWPVNGVLHIPSQVWPETPRTSDDDLATLHAAQAAKKRAEKAAGRGAEEGSPLAVGNLARWVWKASPATAAALRARGLRQVAPAPWAASRDGATTARDSSQGRGLGGGRPRVQQYAGVARQMVRPPVDMQVSEAGAAIAVEGGVVRFDGAEAHATIGFRAPEVLHLGTQALKADVDGFWQLIAGHFHPQGGAKAHLVGLFSGADKDRDVALTKPELDTFFVALTGPPFGASSAAPVEASVAASLEAAFADADAPPADGKVTLGEFLESAERARLRENYYKSLIH